MTAGQVAAPGKEIYIVNNIIRVVYFAFKRLRERCSWWKMLFLVFLHITRNMKYKYKMQKKRKKNQDLDFFHVVSLLLTGIKSKGRKVTGESVGKGVTLVDKHNEVDRDQTSEPLSRSNRCDFLSPSSNHGWIMRPTSRTAALGNTPVEMGRQSVTLGGRKEAGR